MVTIARAAVSVTFPSRFMLAAAMNPCPCGYFDDPTRECHCTEPKLIRKFCAISQDGEKLLENAVTRLGLSALAHTASSK